MAGTRVAGTRVVWMDLQASDTITAGVYLLALVTVETGTQRSCWS